MYSYKEAVINHFKLFSQTENKSLRGCDDKLTEEAFKVLWTTMVRPVGVLQVPNCPLLVLCNVFQFQSCGSIASRFCPEACDYPESSKGHRTVPRSQTRPVAATLFPAALLQEDNDVEKLHIETGVTQGTMLGVVLLVCFKITFRISVLTPKDIIIFL